MRKIKLQNHRPRIVVIRVAKHEKKEGETQQDFLARQPDPEQYVRLLPMGTVDIDYDLIQGNSSLLDMIRNGDISIAGEADSKASKTKKPVKRSLDDMIADANIVAKTTKDVMSGKGKPAKQTPAPESSDPEKDKFMSDLPDNLDELIELGDLEYDLEVKRTLGVNRAKEAIWKKHKESQ